MSRRIANAVVEEIKVGQKVDRLDGFKRGGVVMAVRRDPDYWRQPVLVRWPTLNDEWCSAELLMPREENRESANN